MEVINIQVPNDPHTEATRTQVRIWEKKVYDYVTRCTVLEQNIKSTHFLIWGQCSDLMQQKVEASEGIDSITKRGDAIELLKIIKIFRYFHVYFFIQIPMEKLCFNKDKGMRNLQNITLFYVMLPEDVDKLME
jgi:hypothetical protein